MGPYRQELADLGVIQLEIQPLKMLLQTLSKQHQILNALGDLKQHVLAEQLSRYQNY
jgi:hypothetical protein